MFFVCETVNGCKCLTHSPRCVRQMIPKKKVFRPSSVAVKSLSASGGRLKGRLLDWDSPSSGTGTVRRRPASTSPSSSCSTPSSPPSSSSTVAVDTSSSALNKSSSSADTETTCSDSFDDRRADDGDAKSKQIEAGLASEGALAGEFAEKADSNEKNIKIVINKESRTVVIHKRVSSRPQIASDDVANKSKEAPEREAPRATRPKSKQAPECVAVETAPSERLEAEKKHKLDDLHKSRSKVVARREHGNAQKRSASLRQSPAGSRFKFQELASPTSPALHAPARLSSQLTELYRDFPPNSESVPLRPPPYINPPPPPVARAAEDVPARSRHEADSPLRGKAQIQYNLAVRKQRSRRYLLSLSPTVSKLIKNSPLHLRSPAMADDGSVTTAGTESAAHRIANELRSKGNSALHRLTINISKLNVGKGSAATQPKRVDGAKGSSDRSEKTEASASGSSGDDHGIDSDGEPDAAPATQSAQTSPCDILTRPEFTSSQLQNIPVRPRKGVPHLENYCLFDPRKDFVNEKELMRRRQLAGDCMPFPVALPPPEAERPLIYDTLDDIQEEAECANYFTIDPDYYEHEARTEAFGGSGMLQPIVESDAEEVYSDEPAKQPHRAAADESSRAQPSPADSERSKPPTHLALAERQNAPLSHDGGGNDGAVDTLKLSVSSPELSTRDTSAAGGGAISANSAANNKCELAPLESNYVLFNPAPVPSRSVQYKIRHARPSSAHSDADSGFLSPVTPPEAGGAIGAQAHAANEQAPAVLVLQQCDSIQGYIEVSNCVFFLSPRRLISTIFQTQNNTGSNK